MYPKTYINNLTLTVEPDGLVVIATWDQEENTSVVFWSDKLTLRKLAKELNRAADGL